jgi:hypothetical protein
MYSHESGCILEQEPTSNASPEVLAPAVSILEKESSDADVDPAEGRRDESLAILTPHRTGKRQVQKDHSPSDILDEVHVSRKIRSKEKVYVEQPPGFQSLSHPENVYKLDIAFYGLKQAPRAWYERLSTHLIENVYVRGSIDKTMFVKTTFKDIFIAQIYVDDFVFGSTSESMVKEFSTLMTEGFEMSHCGKLNYFLGLQVVQKDDELFISQSKYVEDLVKKFGMEAASAVQNPMGTSCKMSADLEGYPDLDWASDANDRKSTSGGASFVGNNLVSWHSKKQNGVSLSTIQAEYIAAGSCCTQLLWMKHMLADYGFKQGLLSLFCDNTSAINISKNCVLHSRTKHIEIRYHFIRNLVEEQLLELTFILIEQQLVDLFAKPLDNLRFTSLRKAIVVCDMD